MTLQRRKEEAKKPVAAVAAEVVVVAEVVEVVAVVEAETTPIALVDLVATEPTLLTLADNSTDEDRLAALMRVLGNTIDSVLKAELTNNAITLTPEAALAVKAESKLQTFIIQSWNRICNAW
jgi:hypothetical protein